MRLLLDTGTFLWFIAADRQLPAAAVAVIREPANEVWLSAVSLWEIVVKYQLGRLSLPQVPSVFVPQQRRRHGIGSIGLTEEAVAQLEKLPAPHRDPFDRMLVCQAIAHELTIVTSDPAVVAYPVRTLWPT